MPDIELTRALIREMAATAEEKGVPFVVLHWSWGTRPSDLAMYQSLGVEVIDLSTHAPEDWNIWWIPGDGHPTARAHERAATRRLAPQFQLLRRTGKF